MRWEQASEWIAQHWSAEVDLWDEETTLFDHLTIATKAWTKEMIRREVDLYFRQQGLLS